MSISIDDYLPGLYRLEELEGWQLLARHLELMEEFSFIVILAPDDAAVAYIRSRLSELVGSPEAVQRVTFDPSAATWSLAEELLKIAPLPNSVRLIWIDADPDEPEHIPERIEAWRKALSRLNRYRNTLQTNIHCTLALAGPFSLQTVLREAAPDLWSIRSAVFRIEPVGSARGLDESSRFKARERIDPEGVGLPGNPSETLAEAKKIRGKPGREILLAQLLRRAGRQAFRLLKWDLAIECLQEAYILDEAHGGDPELRLQIANEIAVVFSALAQWDRALHYSKKALEVANAHFGAMHPNTATALNNLAHLLQATNRFAEAEPFMRRALAIDESSYGIGHPKVAIDLNNLATLLQGTNRLAEAEPLMRQAVAIDERSYGTNHPKVAIDLNNLAQLLLPTNRLSEAESLMRRALTIDERNYGTDHPKVAIRLNNLATLLQATNRLSEAEPLMRRALVIAEHSYGTDHPNVAIYLNNLAQLLKATNRLSEAEPLMRRALAIDERSYGTNHPEVASILNNLAQLLQDTNRLAEAEPLMHRALGIDEHSYGTNHPEVATDLINLASLLKVTNRFAEAEPLYRRAASILIDFRRRNGYEHPQPKNRLG